MTSTHLTRGTGLLEAFLAQLRARKANDLIPQQIRSGRILDIGCGSYPYFLSHTSFSEKFAIDQQKPSDSFADIDWQVLDLDGRPNLPFQDEFFSAVSLLAVVEHLNPKNLVCLFDEIHRILLPNGILVLTTPAAWSNNLLKLMARLRLVSPEEISEHVYAYTLPLLGWYFGRAGFSMEKVRFGYFEIGLNLWAVAQK